MSRKLQLIVCVFFILSFSFASAQNKYAVLVGINQYYTKPGVPYYKVLQGCVNDALAIKAMLIQRFGFKESAVTTLFDGQATKENVLAALLDVVAKSKTGDAVVFYFSGHGVWMSNTDQSPLDSKVKDGMNQAMVMSNLYAENLGCLFTDALIKNTFNKFVDKKVVLTSIFDCCFSGDLPMAISPFGENRYDYGYEFYEEKALEFRNVYYEYNEFYTENPASHPAGSLDSILIKEMLLVDSSRAFDMGANITISNKQFITRPSERPGSMFLSLSATNEREKGVEALDETGTRHGVFTSALLHVIKTNPSDIPVAELMRKVKEEMKQQLYIQGPVFHYDNGRIDKNLVGIAPKDFSNNYMTYCSAVKGNTISLGSGTLEGLAAGNTITAKYGTNTVTAVITGATKDAAQAAIKKGNAALVKKGDPFFVTDTYTASAPLLKIFIGSNNIPEASLSGILEQKILPLTKITGYMDYEKWSNLSESRNIYYNVPVLNPGKTADSFITGKIKSNFLVFMPIPVSISSQLKKQLSTNQNIQIVNSTEEAEVSLYLNYVIEREGQEKGFVFTYSTLKNNPVNNMTFRFSDKHVKIADINVSGGKLKKLLADLVSMATLMVRAKGSQWLNDYPARP
ncbi:MAG: caspase family protein [Ferruginibacter sp.]